MPLEVTGFDVQMRTTSFRQGSRLVERNLRQLSQQAKMTQTSLDRMMRTRTGTLIPQTMIQRVDRLRRSIDAATAALRRMAAAGKAAQASMPTQAAGAAPGAAAAFAAAGRPRLAAVPTAAAAAATAAPAFGAASAAATKLGGEAARATGALRAVGPAAATSAGQATKSFQAMNRGIGNTYATGMKLRTLLGTLGGILVLRKAISTLSDFTFAMSGVQAITGASAREMRQMEQVARELGSTTRKTAAEAAEGMRIFAMAGFSAQESMDAIGAALDLSIAGTVELATSVDIVASAVRGFGLEATEAGRVVDVLAVAATNANTTINDLGEGLKYVAPVAAQVGWNVETTAAALGVLADAGIKATMGGTTLRRIISALVAPSGNAVKAIESLDLKLSELDPTIQSTRPGVSRFVDILYTLRDAGIDAGRAFEIFSLRGGPGVLALTRMAERVEELERKTNAAAGAARRMAEVMGNNLRGEALILKSALEELILQVGDAGLTGSLRGLITHMTVVAQLFGGAVSPLDETARGAARTKEAITALGYALGFYLGGRILGGAIDAVIRMRAQLLLLRSAMVATAATGTAAGAAMGATATAATAAGAAAGGAAVATRGLAAAFAGISFATIAGGIMLVVGALVYLATRTRAAEQAVADFRAQIKGFQDQLEELRTMTPEELAGSIQAMEYMTKRQVLVWKQRAGELATAQREYAERGSFLTETLTHPGATSPFGLPGAVVQTWWSRRNARQDIRDLETEILNLRDTYLETRRLFSEGLISKQAMDDDRAEIQRIADEARLQMQLLNLDRTLRQQLELIGLTEQQRAIREAQQQYENTKMQIEGWVAQSTQRRLTEEEQHLRAIGFPTEPLPPDPETEALGTAALNRAEAVLNAQIKAATEAGKGRNKVDREYNDLLRERDRLLRAIQTPEEEYAAQLDLITRLTQTKNKETGKMMMSEEEAARAIEQATVALEEQQEAVNNLLYPQDEFNEKVSRYQELLGSIQTPMEKYRDRLDEINMLTASVGGNTEQALAERKRLIELLNVEMIREGWRQEEEERRRRMDLATAGMPRYARDYVQMTGIQNLGDAVEKMGSQQLPILSDAFSNFFTDLITGSADAKQALISLANEVARSGTRILVEFLMSSALQSAFKPDQVAGGGVGGASLAAAQQLQQLSVAAPSQTVTGGGQPTWMRAVGGVLSLASSAIGGIGGMAGNAWGWLSGLFGGGGGVVMPASNLVVTNIAHRGGIAGGAMGVRAVHPGVFAGASRFALGGLSSDEVPAILHRGELVSPLKAGRLPVSLRDDGSGFTRTPGGTTVPLDIERTPDDGWRSAPVIFQQGAITVVAQKGERLDETAAQAVRRAFAEGARQNRRNRR